MPTETQVRRFVEYARELPRPPADAPCWREPYDNPALICLDVPLSIRNNYRRTVRPRVKKFGREYPQIDSFRALKDMMDRIGYSEFGEVWNFRALHRVVMVDELTSWFLDYEKREHIDDDMAAIRHWCKNVDITAKPIIDVKGMGLSAVQQLRMLADYSTPALGAYLARSMLSVLDEKLSDAESVLVVEEAARELGVDPMDIGYGLYKEFGKR